MSPIKTTPEKLKAYLSDLGFRTIAGADEAGRGALAGPIVAAAVILSPNQKKSEIKDSKKISAKKRDVVYEQIVTESLAWGIGVIEAHIIDENGINEANLIALEKAILGLRVPPDCVLVDWYENERWQGDWLGIAKGEDTHKAIAAASIVAKVTRDRIMITLAEKYPGYGLESHKGYGAPSHLEAIKRIGLSPIHRRSFGSCRSIYQSP